MKDIRNLSKKSGERSLVGDFPWQGRYMLLIELADMYFRCSDSR